MCQLKTISRAEQPVLFGLFGGGKKSGILSPIFHLKNSQAGKLFTY